MTECMYDVGVLERYEIEQENGRLGSWVYTLESTTTESLSLMLTFYKCQNKVRIQANDSIARGIFTLNIQDDYSKFD